MSARTDRRTAIREYKERRIPRGVFAVRCTATGQVWVGSSPNLDAKKNALWFELSHGSHRTQSLQIEWNRHGEEAFAYAILEELDDDVSPLLMRDILKARKLAWIAQLGALPT